MRSPAAALTAAACADHRGVGGLPQESLLALQVRCHGYRLYPVVLELSRWRRVLLTSQVLSRVAVRRIFCGIANVSESSGARTSTYAEHQRPLQYTSRTRTLDGHCAYVGAENAKAERKRRQDQTVQGPVC
jgi:hypothetical protein